MATQASKLKDNFIFSDIDFIISEGLLFDLQNLEKNVGKVNKIP